MLQTHKAALDERVAAGTLTQEQADAMLGFMHTRLQTQRNPTDSDQPSPFQR
jgi:hypothetical protein